MDYYLEWQGQDGTLVETVELALSESGLKAKGIQIGRRPLTYRLDYELHYNAELAMTSLTVSAGGAGWSRRLVVTRDATSGWTATAGGAGEEDLLGHPVAAITDLGLEALDCDLGFSPLTNTLPIRRNGLHRKPGGADVTVAWIQVPHLTMAAVRQRYEHLATTRAGAVVRYRSLESDFTADLDVDRVGLVRVYPGLTERIVG